MVRDPSFASFRCARSLISALCSPQSRVKEDRELHTRKWTVSNLDCLRKPRCRHWSHLKARWSRPSRWCSRRRLHRGRFLINPHRTHTKAPLIQLNSPLAAVCRHLNRSMAHIQEQMELISQQLQDVNMDDCDHLDNSVDDVDAEITRYREILQRMDELELDFDRMKNICVFARALQRRAERTDRVKDGSLYHGRALRQRAVRRHRMVPGVRHMRASQKPGSIGGGRRGRAARGPAGRARGAGPAGGGAARGD